MVAIPGNLKRSLYGVGFGLAIPLLRSGMQRVEGECRAGQLEKDEANSWSHHVQSRGRCTL